MKLLVVPRRDWFNLGGEHISHPHDQLAGFLRANTDPTRCGPEVTMRKVRSRLAVGAFDPGFPTKVGGRHVSGPRSPVRDSSLEDR